MFEYFWNLVFIDTKQFQTEKKVILDRATFNPEMGKLSTYWSIIKVSQRDYLKMNKRHAY